MDTAQRITFAADLLTAMGAPLTHDNVAMLVGWMAREGTTAANNPLATTLPWPHATVFNSVGVRNYASHTDGVDATARTLQSPLYRLIVMDWRAGAGAAAALEHGELETWSGGGYNEIRLADIDWPPNAPTPPAPTPQPEPTPNMKDDDDMLFLIQGDKPEWYLTAITKPVHVYADDFAKLHEAANAAHGAGDQIANVEGGPIKLSQGQVDAFLA